MDWQGGPARDAGQRAPLGQGRATAAGGNTPRGGKYGSSAWRAIFTKSGAFGNSSGRAGSYPIKPDSATAEVTAQPTSQSRSDGGIQIQASAVRRYGRRGGAARLVG
jgi:hypothetical protein